MNAKLISAWIAGLAIVVLYVYATIAALGNFFGMSDIVRSALGLMPWTLLILQVVAPAIALAVALILSRGRSAGMRVLLLATGICAAAAIQLEIMHLILIS